MKLTEEKLKQVFQQQTARSTARQVDCLNEDQFSRAVSGAMDQQERAGVARHLIACSDCAEEYRIVRSLKPWADEAELVLGATLPVASHQEVLPLPTRHTAVASPSFWQSLFSGRAAVALAAMLFLVLFAGVWLAWNRQEHNREVARLNEQLAERDRALNSAQQSLSEKQRRLDELEPSARGQIEKPDQRQTGETGITSGSAPTGTDTERLKEEIATLRQSARDLAQPQLEVPIIDLDSSPVRGGASGPATIDIPPTAKFFTVILNFGGESYPAYEVEILEGGRRVWRGQVRGKGASRSINLTLSRKLIANGNYLVKLSGLKDGSRERVAEYPLQVRYQ